MILSKPKMFANSIRQAKQEAEVFDPETGEPLFHPKIGRAPKQNVKIVRYKSIQIVIEK